jgi:hypothetical protein
MCSVTAAHGWAISTDGLTPGWGVEDLNLVGAWHPENPLQVQLREEEPAGDNADEFFHHHNWVSDNGWKMLFFEYGLQVSESMSVGKVGRFHALHLTHLLTDSLTYLLTYLRVVAHLLICSLTHLLTYSLAHLRYIPCLPAVRAPCARLQRGERACRDLLVLRWHRDQHCGRRRARPQLVQGKLVNASQ